MGKVQVVYRALGALSTNCYFLVNEDTKEVVIVDPADNTNEIVKMIEEKQYVPKAVFLTHGHFDHILATREICNKYGIKCYAHEAEVDIAKDNQLNLSSYFMGPFTLNVDETFTDNEKVDIAGMHFEVIHTPGHTKGSCCYYLRDEGILISGDTIFNESVGRTDFPTGNGRHLLLSIKERIFTLPDETRIYPGHGDETTVAYEKVHNCSVDYI